MNRIWAIASNTFREAIRDRVLYLLLVFALVFIASAQILSLLTVGSEEKIIKDLGLASISLFGVLTALFKGFADPGLLLAVYMIFLELLLVTALAILFSSFSTPILSTLFALSLYLVGHLSWSLNLLRDRLTGGAGRWVCRALYLILPNLEIFNIKAEVVHGTPIPASLPLWATLYLAGYGVVVLSAACLIFQRKDFN
jgi:ABC-type transport system involved in multi-copper enzyme maturation permease subunit